ncbi:acyl-CoA-binding domain-containing protein 4 [Folsomia candida]|uniref:acyl-CoA-binding domain-containing protein 4 n=1 Tax=Folsomia candida TaxID=158441 RepID=UPI000B8F5960|nr:acyl-CoA-binding domain-containing protein 4 [Folsomia candida]
MSEDAELDAEFERVVQLVQNLPKEGPYQPSNGEKLRFYSLYKQATVGPCDTSRPGFFDLTGKAKWDAWNELGDMSKTDAKRKYIEAFAKMEQKMKDLGHTQ